MGAILLGSANGSPPDLGVDNSIPIPSTLPIDPIVLTDVVGLGAGCIGGGIIDPDILNNYYTKEEINIILGDYVTFDDLVGLEGTPMYVHLVSAASAEGDIHLSNATDWNVDKAVIKMVRVETVSSNWDLYILQNGNGFAANNAAIPALQLMRKGKGVEDIIIDLAYEDEDASQSVHLYFIDNTGSATAVFYIAGFKVQ